MLWKAANRLYLGRQSVQKATRHSPSSILFPDGEVRILAHARLRLHCKCFQSTVAKQLDAPKVYKKPGFFISDRGHLLVPSRVAAKKKHPTILVLNSVSTSFTSSDFKRLTKLQDEDKGLLKGTAYSVTSRQKAKITQSYPVETRTSIAFHIGYYSSKRLTMHRYISVAYTGIKEIPKSTSQPTRF